MNPFAHLNKLEKALLASVLTLIVMGVGLGLINGYVTEWITGIVGRENLLPAGVIMFVGGFIFLVTYFKKN